MKLNTKIIIMLLELALIPWVLGGTIAYLTAQEQINNKTYSDLEAIAAVQKHRVEETLQNKLTLLSVFTTNPDIISALRDIHAHKLSSGEILQKELTKVLGGATGIQKVFIATTVGNVVASTDQTFLGKNVSDTEYFKLGLLHNDASVLMKEATSTVVQYLVGPIVQNGHTEGVLAIVVDANDISSISQDYTGLGNTGESVVVRGIGDGDVLFLTPTRFDPSAALTRIVTSEKTDTPAVQAVKGGASLLTSAVDYRGVKVFAATQYVDSVGWGIVVKIDQSEALMPISKLRDLFVVVITMAGLLTALVGISIARSITGPINQLTLFVEKVARGESQQSIVVTTKDEIGMLSAAFNSMVFKLHESYALLEKKVAERTASLTEKTAEARNSERAALNIAADLKVEEENLTEEKAKAENLANDLKKFKLALDNASDQVVITDIEGIVIYSNKAFEKITGYPQEETVGKKSGALWKSPMSAEFYKNMWHIIKEEKKVFIGEIQNKRKNGELYTATISISPVLDEQGNILFFVGIERDITKEKEIDEAKGEFISLASHQMRTPLTAINWYTEMLRDGDAGKLTVKQEGYFKEIYTAGQQMNDIIKSFLHILRLETGTLLMNPIPTNLVTIAQATLKESQLIIENKHLHVVEQYQESLPLVKVDTELVRVVIQNFISNAMKYTPENGEVKISLESVPKGGVANGKVAEEDSVLVSVHDTGIGIPQADAEKIFTKFFRTDNAKRWDPNGNGLGLYMSRKMVDFIGGSIWFISEEGKGATFCVLLPIAGKKQV